MKHKSALTLTAVTAALCITGNAAFAKPGGAFTSAPAFPFEQLGAALRALSLTGAAGNAASVALYCTLCLMPAAYLLLRVTRRRARAEDALLAALSAVLFAVVYMMINPADISRFFGAPGMADAGRAMLGGVVYSIALGYIVLRALRTFSGSGESTLLRYLYILLAVIGALLVYAVLGAGLRGLIGELREFAAGNTDGARSIGVSYVFIALRYFVDTLPYLLDIVIIFAGLNLITELQREPYSGAAIAAARRLGRVCGATVAAAILSQVTLNVAQLLVGRLARSVRYTLSIPLFTIAFALAALLLAKYFERGKEMKDEGDMFI